jgi:uncharacterized membrane protein YgdD (TMEM256/DUF423 family)
MLSPKTILASGAVLGFLSVALGAFGAHALKDFLTAQNRLQTYETAVQYQMYHALALVLVGVLAVVKPQTNFSGVALCFLWGVLVFSGSLYVLCATGIRWMGAITPIGGLAFLAGWAWLGWKALTEFVK